MKANFYQKIVSAVKYRILSLESEINIIDEEIPLMSQSPGTTELQQTILCLQRNVKSVLHDVLLAYYKHFTEICLPTTTSISSIVKCHLRALNQGEITILLNELYGSQSALNTFVGEEYNQYLRQTDAPQDHQLRLLFQVFPYEFEYELFADSTFFQFLLETVDQYQIENHEQLLMTLFCRMKNQKPKSQTYFFADANPLYFALTEHLFSIFVSTKMHHFYWDELENFSIYQKCKLIVLQGPSSCSCNPELIRLLKSSKDDESLLRIINKEEPFNSDQSIYFRSFRSVFSQLNEGEITSPKSSSSPESRRRVRARSLGLDRSEDIFSLINNQSKSSGDARRYSINPNSINGSNSSNETNSNPPHSCHFQQTDRNDNTAKNSNENQINGSGGSPEMTRSYSHSPQIKISFDVNENQTLNQSEQLDKSNINILTDSNYTSSLGLNDSQSTNTVSFTDSNPNNNDEIEIDEIDHLPSRPQFTGHQLPQLWHVSLELMRIKYQTSPSFALCVLANALNLLTNAITIDGQHVGNDEILVFLVYCLALTEPESLPSLAKYAEKFIEPALQRETKFGYLVTQLQGSVCFLQEKIFAVPPYLVFPFSIVPSKHVSVMKPKETNIVFGGFRVYAFSSFDHESEDVLPAFLQYTGDDDDVAICTSYIVDESASDSKPPKRFSLQMPNLELIPTVNGLFFQLTDDFIEQHHMIHVDNGNLDNSIESLNALSALMKMMPEKDWKKLGHPKVRKLRTAFKVVVKKWKTLIASKAVQKYFDNEDDIALQIELASIDLNRMEIDSVQTVVAQMQRALMLLGFTNLTITGVLTPSTWDAIKEKFNLKDTDYIKPGMYEQLLKKSQST